jgi:voltage-gated potassium channel Kch
MHARPIVLMTAALAAIGLGYWGFQASAATQDGDFLDALYRSVRLFGLAGGDISPPVSWQLQVARVLAPLVVGYAAVQGLATLFREQFLLLRLRLTARNHVVVAGLGDSGFRMVTALHGAGMLVVAVEKDRQNPALVGCRRRGIPVVLGDATDPEALSQARADRAGHRVSLCGPDDVNHGVIAACVELAEAPGWEPARVHAALEHTGLWRALRISALAGGEGDRLRIEFFSENDLTARALVEHAFTRWDGQGDCRVVIDATDAMLRDVAGHVVRVASAGGARPILVLLSDEERDALADEEPSLEDVADLDVTDVDPLTAAYAGGSWDEGGLAFVTVCRDDDPDALAHAAAWAQLTGSRTPVVVAVSGDRVAESLDTARLRPPGVDPLGARTNVLGPSLLSSTALEAIARARHEQYVRLQLSRGESRASNPSLVSWEELPESLRESNRRFADGVGTKIRAMGATLIPTRPGASTPDELALPPEQLSELAREEHERWMADLQAKAWSGTEGDKDAERRLHPLLRSWEELPEAEREKDRDAVRGLPQILAAAGFAIVRTPNGG